MDPILLPLTLIISLVLLAIPSCVCKNHWQYQICSQTLFQCGNISEIGYPFWGGNRPASCGYPGFGLDCQNGITRLNISSMTYRVFSINISTQTLSLRVARDDLWDTICPRFLHSTTLDFPAFRLPSTATHELLILQYGCPSSVLEQRRFFSFQCTANQTESFGFGVYSMGLIFNCNRTIFVPVDENAFSAPVDPEYGSTAVIMALQSGFSIEYLWNDNGTCHNCTLSGGLCGYDLNSESFACYCADRPYNAYCFNPPTIHGLSARQKYAIIGASIGIAGILVSTIIVIYVRKQCRLRKLDQENNHNVNKFLTTHGSLAPKRYQDREIKKITKSFREKLGQGGYGIVYKGKLPNGQLVAVKVLTESDANGEEFINEVASISRTSHVNIVNLLGFCYERKKRALVYEFMPNKSLDKFIDNGGPEAYLEWEKLYDIAGGVARGLEYLHRGCNTRIVHFDIKPQNILLDQDFCPKISDFGLAKLFKKKQSMMSMLEARGTIGYIAPEVFSRNFGRVSHKSDVYSYGMMLLEMAGARKNVKIEAIQSSEDYFPDKIYDYVLLKNKKLDDVMTEENEETARKMLLVGLWCIQTAPSNRPSMTKVLEMLEGSLESIQIPPKPVLSSHMLSGQGISASFSVTIEAEISAEG